MNAPHFDRRQFLVTTIVAAGGMMLTLSTAQSATAAAMAPGPWAPDSAPPTTG
jgi:hypothetical protein